MRDFGNDFPDALIEFPKLVIGVGVVQTEHWDFVNDLGEFGERLSPDAPGRGIGRNEFRVLGLQLFEPFDQPVILAVADLRRRLDIVFPVVAADFLA